MFDYSRNYYNSIWIPIEGIRGKGEQLLVTIPDCW